ncbi:MAG: hypothetical protein IJ587_06925 [Synergistaceae bacterium]|nr:hypothetical protein [Synergistaceae bacterium]
MLADNLISKLEALGGKRWTKGQYDRMYFNSEVLGVSCEMYKTGNVSYAEIIEWDHIDGVDMDSVNSVTGKISNRAGSAYLRGKYYIDLTSGKIVAGELEERVRYLLKKAEAAIAADARSEAPSAPKKARKARKLTAEETVLALARAKSKEEIRQVLKKSLKKTLYIFARSNWFRRQFRRTVKSFVGFDTLVNLLTEYLGEYFMAMDIRAIEDYGEIRYTAGIKESCLCTALVGWKNAAEARAARKAA